MFGGSDRVPEQDGWAWMRVTNPWMQSGQDHEINAGFEDYDVARASLEDVYFDCPGATEALQRSKIRGALVLCLPFDCRPWAFSIFAVRRGIRPNQIGPAGFAKWKSGLPKKELLTARMPRVPTIWPL